jgi:raffinose/stachyose/melibiose transport system permease protein
MNKNLFNEKPINKNIASRVSLTGIVFLVPSLLFVIFSVYIPFVWNIILSFEKWDGFKKYSWVNLNNYAEILKTQDVFRYMKNSVFLALSSTVISVVLGLILAGLIYQMGKKESAFYRLVFFMPVMLPLAIIGLLFTFVYNPDMGILNNFLKLVGLGSQAKAWLENSNTVMWCISIVDIWSMTGLTMMLCFASMQSLPQSLFESAHLDGAGYIRQFFSIMIPLIKPIIQLSAVFTLVKCFKSYDLVFVMTRGGPGDISTTVPINMLITAFSYSEFGLSAATGVVFSVVILIIVFITKSILKGEQYEY